MSGALGRLTAAIALFTAVAAGAALAQTLAESVKGAWTSGGPSFDMLIQDRTILFEFDMKEHPYRLDGDTLVIDFQDPTLGVQRKRIIRLTADELEIEDEQSGARETLRRMRDDRQDDAAIGWIGLYTADMLEWMENSNRLDELCSRSAGDAQRASCEARLTAPRRFSFVLRSAPRESAQSAGTLVVVADPKTGLRVLYEPPGGGAPIPFTPDVFDSDWGYGPYFHQTYRSRGGTWFELPADPFRGSAWIDAADFGDEPHLLALAPGDIVTGALGDVIVLSIDADAIVVRPEQQADMWCKPGPPPAPERVLSRRILLADLYSRSGHLLLRPKYMRGC